jgi:hypothetical protein
MSIPFGVLTIYDRFLDATPRMMQIISMSVFCGLGDLFAQSQVLFRTERSLAMRSYDWKRCHRFLLKGIGCGIIWSQWFILADAWSEIMTVWFMGQAKMSPDNPSVRTIVCTTANLLLEQFIACPIIFGLWDLPVLSIMNGRPLSSIPAIFCKKLLRLLVLNAKLWTVVNIVIYNIPLKYRVLLVSITDIFWESLVSTIARQQEAILSRQDCDHIAVSLTTSEKEADYRSFIESQQGGDEDGDEKSL